MKLTQNWCVGSLVIKGRWVNHKTFSTLPLLACGGHGRIKQIRERDASRATRKIAKWRQQRLSVAKSSMSVKSN